MKASIPARTPQPWHMDPARADASRKSHTRQQRMVRSKKKTSCETSAPHRADPLSGQRPQRQHLVHMCMPFALLCGVSDARAYLLIRSHIFTCNNCLMPWTINSDNGCMDEEVDGCVLVCKRPPLSLSICVYSPATESGPSGRRR